MIRTLLALIPADRRGKVGVYAVLASSRCCCGPAATVLLVPLVAALFGERPADAWPWLGWLTAGDAGRAGWSTPPPHGSVSTWASPCSTAPSTTWPTGCPHVRLDWFDADNTATARQAIAATGPDLVGLVVNLLTPLLDAVLLPARDRAGAVRGGAMAARRSRPWPGWWCCSAR